MANNRYPQDQYQEDDNYNDRNRDRDRDRCDDDDPRPENPAPCGEGPTPTESTIQRERNKLCNELKDKAGDVRQWEQNRLGTHQLYNDKKCLFIRTETNYQYYRNIELLVGAELMQVNADIKANVTVYKQWNDELAATLKELVKAAIEAKGKFAELKKAACDLDTCLNDSCQATQRKILTGEPLENCNPINGEVEDKCNALDILFRLKNIPNILFNDIDVIFNSAARVAGIQAFSNISTLGPLQITMQERSKAFDDFILEKMTKGSEDHKKAQEELMKAIQENARSTSALYFKRSDFKGVQEATRQLCACNCDCIDPSGPDKRLERCKCGICDICDQVKTGVCRTDDNPACRPPHQKEDIQSLTY